MAEQQNFGRLIRVFRRSQVNRHHTMHIRLLICIAVLASAQARLVEHFEHGALFPGRDAWSASYTQDAVKDRVDHLPGAPPGGPQLYSG